MPLWKSESRIFPSSQSSHKTVIGEYGNHQHMIRIHMSGERFNLEKNRIAPLPTKPGQQEANAIRLIENWTNGSTEFSFHTSGSTGTPRKIVFHRDQLEASARLTEKALQLKPGFTALVCLDVNFIAGAMMIVRCLVTKMNMVIRSASSNPIEGPVEPIDFAAFVPQQLQTILEQSPELLDQFQTILVGGAPLRKDVIEKLQKRSASFYGTYGMTETLTHIALQKLNEPGRQNEFHLLHGINASRDHRGCLVIQAPHLGPHPIITNDLVDIFSDTTFTLQGRIDQVINSGGIKIQPLKIEETVQSVLHALGIKLRFFAAGLPDETLGERLVLVVEGSPLSLNEKEQILSALAGVLGKFETPKAIVFVPRFFYTMTQKIDRIATLQTLK